jgi:uncharacterized membrane protein
MRAVVIATAWIAFSFLLIGLVLLGLASKYDMKDAATDGDKAKARKMGMAGFWILVVALIFALIAAITASCSTSLAQTLSSVAQRMAARNSSQPTIMS